MAKPGIATSRSSAGDLGITFEVNGEKYTFYVEQNALKSRKASDTVTALTDELTCAICCSQKASFALCMARCVEGDGKCCDAGATNCD